MNAMYGIGALTFVASAAVTTAWCVSMSGMPGMEMPGGWTMSMAWMRMPGQGWLDYAAMFLGMWAVMMPAMMLPALMPMLAQYREGVRGSGALTSMVAAGYFAVWMLAGVALFPLGVAFAGWTMRAADISRMVPLMGALVVLAAGATQFSAWKSRQLDCCRDSLGRRAPASNYRAAWRHGIGIGLGCFRCCAGLTAVLLVIGVMDLRAMALVTTAISAERLMPASLRVARGVGAGLLAMGVWMLCETMIP